MAVMGLHLHTPFTQKGDHFAGVTSEEKWDNFYHSIHEYVGDGSDPFKEICAITDQPQGKLYDFKPKFEEDGDLLELNVF